MNTYKLKHKYQNNKTKNIIKIRTKFRKYISLGHVYFFFLLEVILIDNFKTCS